MVIGHGAGEATRGILPLGAAVLCLLAPHAAAQDQSAEVDRLKATVERMQKQLDEQARKIDALEKASAKPPAVEVAPELAVDLGRPQTFIVDKDATRPGQRLAPRYDNAPLQPALPGFWKIPGTEMLFRIGGDTIGAFIVTSLLMPGATTWFITSSIPVSGASYASSPSQLSGTANQSDVNFEFRAPTPVGQIRVVYRNDFAQPGSPAFVYHVKDFYVQAANLLVGYTESVFADIDAQPNTLDYEGPNSLISARHALVRYALGLARGPNGDLIAVTSLESPSPQIPSSAGIPRSVAPDLAIAARLEGRAGHLQLSTVLRAVGSQDAAGQTQTVLGWGLSLTGNLNVPGGDFATFQVAGGQGISAYVNDTGGLGLDAALSPSGQLTALSILGIMVSYTHQWGARCTSTASYGYLTLDTPPYEATLGSAAFQRSQYASLNLVVWPFKYLLVGAEGLWGYNHAVGGASGQAWRGQLNVQYTF
ncbi:MAG TPA: hypothetical protein VEI47_00060 [Gemmatimonadales bacterium]|nr:hypothetical protein [Gemmatimonadales bacterium]